MTFTLAHLYLALAITVEVIGSVVLKMTDSFTRLIPSVVVCVCYLLAVYFMTLSVRTLSIGFVYAVWAGIGIAAVAIAGVFIYDEPMDWPGAFGIALIIIGVVILNAFSKVGGGG